jgi:hypothetical protein
MLISVLVAVLTSFCSCCLPLSGDMELQRYSSFTVKQGNQWSELVINNIFFYFDIYIKNNRIYRSSCFERKKQSKNQKFERYMSIGVNIRCRHKDR